MGKIALVFVLAILISIPGSIWGQSSWENKTTTKQYGTTNGFKNMTPNKIYEKDPYSGQIKEYGTTNGFKNMTPNNIYETR